MEKIQLTLTLDEAEALMCLIGRTKDGPFDFYERLADAVESKLGMTLLDIARANKEKTDKHILFMAKEIRA